MTMEWCRMRRGGRRDPLEYAVGPCCRPVALLNSADEPGKHVSGSSLGLGPAPSPAIHLSPCLAAHNRLAPAIYSSTKAKNAPTTRPISALDRGAPPRITEGVAECVGLLAVVAGGGVDVDPTDSGTDADGAEDPETAAWESWLAHAQTGMG